MYGSSRDPNEWLLTSSVAQDRTNGDKDTEHTGWLWDWRIDKQQKQLFTPQSGECFPIYKWQIWRLLLLEYTRIGWMLTKVTGNSTRNKKSSKYNSMVSPKNYTAVCDAYHRCLPQMHSDVLFFCLSFFSCNIFSDKIVFIGIHSSYSSNQLLGNKDWKNDIGALDAWKLTKPKWGVKQLVRWSRSLRKRADLVLSNFSITPHNFPELASLFFWMTLTSL